MGLTGDKARVAYAHLVAKMWREPDLRRKFVQDPKAVLSGEGIDLPADTTVSVLENTESVHYVVLPEGADPADPAMQLLLKRLIPLDGIEARVVQDQPKLVHAVIPTIPSGFSPSTSTHDELAAVVAGGATAVNLYAAANVVGAANVAGVQNVGGATEGVVVAVGAAVLT
jgi:hypothetical protein